MTPTEKQLARQNEMKEMLKLFAKHDRTLTHQQCQDAGICDPHAVTIDLTGMGHRLRCSFQQHLYFRGASEVSWCESVYELVHLASERR